MAKRCPFYGFRWPERKSDLFEVGGSECGLDIDRNGACRMELEGSAVDFRRCEVAAAATLYLELGSGRIGFYPSGANRSVPLPEWTRRVLTQMQPLPNLTQG